MRVTFIAVGSRGDVQPCVALGLGLRRAGHDVRLATHERFEAFVREHGLDFAPIAEGNLSRGTETEEGRRWVEKGGPAWRGLLRDAASVAHRRVADCRDACEGADAIAVSILGTLLGYHLAEKLHVPLIRAYPVPPDAFTAGRRLPRQALWLLSRSWVNSARREVLELPPLPVREPLGRLRTPLLYGYSPAVVPPAGGEVTGYWFLHRSPGWKPPASLAAFLAAGSPPVFVGFGSMADRDPAATTALMVKALRRAGRRGVLVRGSHDADLPPDVFAVDSIPYDWLFARVTAAVHHGGAGTTAWALRAGLPSVLVPEFADQPYWARRAHALGVAPPPIPRRKLSAERLAQAIQLVTTDAAMERRAAALAHAIRAEDGVARAVEAFERHVTARAPASPPRRAARTAAGS